MGTVNDGKTLQGKQDKETLDSVVSQVYELTRKMDQMRRLMGHCTIAVPAEPTKAKELMEIAMNLGGMDHVVGHCVQAMTVGLNASNALCIFKFASENTVQCLVEASRKYILQNFMSVYSHDDLLTLSVKDLTGFLTDNNLQVTSEEIVFEAVLRWVLHDVSWRKTYLEDLTASVRLRCCNLRFLKHLKDHYLLHDSISFQKSVQSAINSMENGPSVALDEDTSIERRPRQFGIMDSSLFGGPPREKYLELNSTKRMKNRSKITVPKSLFTTSDEEEGVYEELTQCKDSSLGMPPYAKRDANPFFAPFRPFQSDPEIPKTKTRYSSRLKSSK